MKRKIFSSSLIFISLITSCLKYENGLKYAGEAKYVDHIDKVENTYSKIKSNFDIPYYASKSASYTNFLPSVGDAKLLVIPVDFKDTPVKLDYTVVKEKLDEVIFGDNTSWESVASYYRKSSFGKLNISGKVTDVYECKYTNDAFAQHYQRESYTTNELLNDALSWYKETYNDDLTEYDIDKDGIIDSVYLVYLDPYYTEDEKRYFSKPNYFADIYWAFTTWNLNCKPDINSPNGGAYFWVSYYFILESYGEEGLDAHTFIHETGHLLSLDDYYSYNYLDKFGKRICPIGGADMMDFNVMDHNCYSKFVLGWVEPYLIDHEGKITIDLATNSGDCILIPTEKFNNTCTDEYIMLELFAPNNLNYEDLINNSSDYSKIWSDGKLSNIGIRAYHIDSRLCSYELAGKNYSYATAINPKYISSLDSIKGEENKYTVFAHTNSPDGYSSDGTKVASLNLLNNKYRLIQVITPEGIDYSKVQNIFTNLGLYYTKGKMNFSDKTFTRQFPNGSLANNGSKFKYNFKVEEMSETSCTISFSENK